MKNFNVVRFGNVQTWEVLLIRLLNIKRKFFILVFFRKCPNLAAASTSGKKELRCSTCGFYFAHKSSLHTHVRFL
jgi:hypothetical protein